MFKVQYITGSEKEHLVRNIRSRARDQGQYYFPVHILPQLINYQVKRDTRAQQKIKAIKRTLFLIYISANQTLH